MSPGDWAAITIGIAALIVALVGLPPTTPYRRGVFATSGLLVVVAVTIGAVDNVGLLTGSGSGGGSSPTTSAQPSQGPLAEGLPAAPTPPGQAPITGESDAAPDIGENGASSSDAQSFARVDLSADASTPATLYFGQLDAVLGALEGTVTFNTSSTMRARDPQLCVATVVFTDVPGSSGVVYALGFEQDAWRAAEGSPDNTVEGPASALHQQLLVPPLSISAGQSWQGSAELHQDSTVIAVSSSYTLSLVAADGDQLAWEVQPDGASVDCRAS